MVLLYYYSSRRAPATWSTWDLAPPLPSGSPPPSPPVLPSSTHLSTPPSCHPTGQGGRPYKPAPRPRLGLRPRPAPPPSIATSSPCSLPRPLLWACALGGPCVRIKAAARFVPRSKALRCLSFGHGLPGHRGHALKAGSQRAVVGERSGEALPDLGLRPSRHPCLTFPPLWPLNLTNLRLALCPAPRS